MFPYFSGFYHVKLLCGHLMTSDSLIFPCSLIQQTQKLFSETSNPSDTRNVCKVTLIKNALIIFFCWVIILWMLVYFACLSFVLLQARSEISIKIIIGFSICFANLPLEWYRWDFNLLGKQCILLYGLLLYHFLWSCWVSLHKNGSLLEVLGQFWLLLLAERWNLTLIFITGFFGISTVRFRRFFSLFMQKIFHRNWVFFFIGSRFWQTFFQVLWFMQPDHLFWMSGFKQR